MSLNAPWWGREIHLVMRTIHLRFYLLYKLLNALFLGCSLGSVFIIYAPLNPKIYSIGGITLALGAWILTFLRKNPKEKPYKVILLGIELIPFAIF